MKSPTSTILNSIQVLKSKLRSDHLELQGIRRDFAMGPTKPIIQLQERSQSPVSTNFKANKSLEKNARAKLIQIRKNHQMELKSIAEKHKHEKQQLINDYQNKIQEITAMFEQKISEQVSYIQILQEQTQEANLSMSQHNKTAHLQLCPGVCEVICAEMTFDNKINFQLFAASSQHETKCNQQTMKYEKIVNELLHQNAALLESVETLKMENRRLLYHSTMRENSDQDRKSLNSKRDVPKNQLVQSRSSQYLSLVPVSVQQGISDSCYRTGNQSNKNRLKFSKGGDRMKNLTERSYASIGNQNIDTSNIIFRNANSIQKPSQQNVVMANSIVEEDQDSILSEEMKLRTIKHFMRANSHRSTQTQQCALQYVVPKMPLKKGVGIRNALKKISV